MDKKLDLMVNLGDHADKICEHLRKHINLSIKILLIIPLLLIDTTFASTSSSKSPLPHFGKSTPLPKLNLDPKITVSGLSSGGYMANQFHMAYAESIDGAAIIAAGPYDCSEGSLKTAQEHCLNKDVSPPVEKLIQIAKDRAQAKPKQLADVAELKNDKVWVFHGTADPTVAAPVTQALVDFYKAFVTEDPETNIVFINNIAAGHGFPTIGEEVECSLTGPPFINKCNYDAAGALLNHLYGKLNAPVEPVQKIRPFDQTLYSVNNSGLARIGYLYVPQNCAEGAQCKLHVSFHGCKQTAKMIGDRYMTETGLNRWAESNNLVILYPQTDVTQPVNPFACWDWWGYTNESFAERDGVQMKSVWKMVQALRGLRV